MPIGSASSSARCPRRPAHRARRAKPRMTLTGRSRSASTAPHVPAPFSGNVRPRTWGCTRPMAANSSRWRPERSLLPGELEQHGGARVLDPVHGMAETGNEAPRLLRSLDEVGRQLVPPGRVLGQRPLLGEAVREEPGRVLGDPEEPRAATEQTGGERALERLGRARVGQPGGDRSRGEAVVGQGDQHGLEHRQLLRRRRPLGHQPEGQVAEGDLSDQVVREVLTEQGDLVRRGRPDARPVRRGPVGGHRPGSGSTALRSHALISSECSPSSGGGSR